MNKQQMSRVAYFLLFCMLLCYPLFAVTVGAAPVISFVVQSPPDLDVQSIYSIPLSISYFVSSAGTLNSSSINLYYKTNNSVNDVFEIINGTARSGFFRAADNFEVGIVNASGFWNFSLPQDEVYPGVHNLPLETFISNVHTTYSLTSTSRYIAVKLLNVSASKEYNYVEAYYNNSAVGSANSTWLYYCNSSYSVGAMSSSPSCVLVVTIPANTPRNHTHGNNVSHWIWPMPINATTGKIGSVKVTSTSYLIFVGPYNGVSWNLYTVPFVTLPDSLRVSANGGIAYSSYNVTADLHLHQYDGDDSLYYYLCGSDDGGQSCSDVRRDFLRLGTSTSDFLTVESVSPVNGFTTSSSVVSFECNASDVVQNLSAVGLRVFNESNNLLFLDAVGTSGAVANHTFTLNFSVIGIFRWSCFANNTAADFIFSNNRTLNLTAIPIVPVVGNVSVINASNQGFVSLIYPRYPFVFRNVNTTMLLNVTDVAGNEVLGADVVLSMLGYNYSIGYSSYYGSYAFTVLFLFNETFIDVPFRVSVSKFNYSFTNITGSFVVSNYSLVSVRIYKDNEAKDNYKNSFGYIFAVRRPTSLIKVRHNEERLLAPLPLLTAWGERVFGLNYSTLYKWPNPVIVAPYVDGVAYLGLPGGEDYAFYFVDGTFYFASSYEGFAYYSDKRHEIYLGSTRIGGDTSLKYQIDDFDLNWMAVITRWLVLIFIFLFVVAGSVVFFQATGDFRIFGSSFLFLLLVLPTVWFIMKLIWN